MKQIKIRAVRDGRKLKDAIADLLRKGLAVKGDKSPIKEAAVGRDKKTGLPLVKCKHAARPGEELSLERAVDVLLAQEVAWHHEASG